MTYFQLPTQVFATLRRTGHLAGHTGRWAGQVTLRALDAVQEGLRAEVQAGHVRLVADFLADKALPAAKALLLERLTARLLLRLGLRGTMLTSVAGWVLPFVLEKLFLAARSSGLLARLEAAPPVAEALLWLDELRQRAARLIFPDGDTGAEVVPDEAAGQVQKRRISRARG